VLLDEASIAERRVSLEEANIRVQASGSYICHFCNKRFKGETMFMKHHCEQKRKQQELHSPLGQAAFGYYRAWMRFRGFREQSSNAFLDSKFYRSFINFARLVQDANIGEPERYIQLMVESTIQPALWVSPNAYKLYLNWFDNQQEPLEQVQASINMLMDIAEKEGVDYRGVLQHIGSQRVLELINQRRLSPWFLFHSATFSKLLQSLSKEEQRVFHRALNAQLWIDRLQENPEKREEIKVVVRAVEL
jgi:hypothetical protein